MVTWKVYLHHKILDLLENLILSKPFKLFCSKDLNYLELAKLLLECKVLYYLLSMLLLQLQQLTIQMTQFTAQVRIRSVPQLNKGIQEFSKSYLSLFMVQLFEDF